MHILPAIQKGERSYETHAGREGARTRYLDRRAFCTRILGEFGADVVKVESPDGGDPLRQWRKLHQGTSLWWSVQARNKKSLTANLKHPEGLAIVRQLAAEADIVVENFRPGVLEKLGLGWDVLSAANPGW
jgi:formyl-CoA transferase